MIRTLPHRRSLLVLAVVLGAAVATVSAEDRVEELAAEDGPERHVFFPKKRWVLQGNPRTDLYPRYVADPRTPRFAFVHLEVTDSDIPDTGSKLFRLAAGGQWGVLRYHPSEDAGRGFQFDLAAGFLGHFDQENALDNVGWDGFMGAAISYAPWDGLAFRFSFVHDSAHVGDEYAQRTGRMRINYTRQEFGLGVSWKFVRGWRVYGEVADAWGRDVSDPVSNIRAQAGLEYRSPLFWWGKRVGWYAAADLSSFQFDDWDISTTIQAGLEYPLYHLARAYRLGFEYHDGRSVLGEFSINQESYIGFGIWIDL